MTRRPKAPVAQLVRVFYRRVVDVEHSDFTVEAFGALTPNGTLVGCYGHVRVGPGMGPHTFRDIRTIRRMAWALHKLADALENAGGYVPARDIYPDGHIPGQLTIHDVEEVPA